MPTIQEIVTPTVAAVGLGLSIYNTVQARRDKRPKVQVKVYFGMLAFGPKLSDQQFFFEVGNAWNQPITLASISIPLPGDRSMAFIDLNGERPMPVVLTPGMSTRFWQNAAQLEAQTMEAGIGRHEKFRAMACDALGNKYFSESISFKPMK